MKPIILLTFLGFIFIFIRLVLIKDDAFTYMGGSCFIISLGCLLVLTYQQNKNKEK